MQTRVKKWSWLRKATLIGLSAVFCFAWLLFVLAYYRLFQKTGRLETELGAILIAVLGLFGAVNVMILSAFFLILLIWWEGRP